MFNPKSIFAAALMALAFAAPVAAAESHSVPEIAKQNWSFGGVFGKYDENQLQRGFQVFREVCSSCHGAHLLAFRNLSEEGGPSFSEAQVKALAAEYDIVDPSATGGTRKGVAADRWPSPFSSEQDARDANGGALPPDMSVLAKARGTTQPGLWWILNYFTAYQEGGPDYIHALLNGYEETPPEGTVIPDGKHYNHYFPGHAIGMAPPLSDGVVTYEAGESGEVPLTLEQYSQDVSAFLMWVADPHLNARKEAGFKVLLFLILFAGLMYFTKKRIWRGVEH